LPERPALPADLKALIEKFNAARETYLTDQKALFEQLRTAAEADRAAIREKIQANREEFLTATKTLREDIRTQMQNLRDQLPTRKEVIDNAGPRPGSRPGVN
jgi:exonuclease VII large subunit